MADASILLSPASAILPDGSTGNAAPALERIQGTEANPKKHLVVGRFDAAVDEFMHWTFIMPQDAAAAPTLKLNVLWSSVGAITGTNVVWAASINAVSPADADTPIEHAGAAAQSVTDANDTNEAGRLNTAQITFTNAQGDNVVPGDLVTIEFSRDADNGSDTLAEDARLYAVEFVYTLA